MKHLWIWCLFNTVVICMLALMIHINVDIQNKASEDVEKLRIELNAYKIQQRDTFVINIDNRLNFPKTITLQSK